MSRLLVGGVAAGAALCSLALSQVLWPMSAGVTGPPARLVPGFVVLSVVESLVFGMGVAFALTGLPLLRRGAAGPALTWATYLSVIWLLVSWWPHDNVHRVLPHNDWAGLLRIEYGFHLTLIAAALIVARYVLSMLERQPS
jgi:hypothetical protein